MLFADVGPKRGFQINNKSTNNSITIVTNEPNIDPKSIGNQFKVNQMLGSAWQILGAILSRNASQRGPKIGLWPSSWKNGEKQISKNETRKHIKVLLEIDPKMQWLQR